MAPILSANEVFLDVPASTRDQVIDFFCEKAEQLGYTDDPAELRRAFLAREAEGTCGMVSGFAIPHAKTAAVSEPHVLVAKLQAPVEWETMDRQPVDVAIALLIPDDGAGHLRLLSQIAVLLMKPEFVESVRAAQTPAAVAEAIDAGLR